MTTLHAANRQRPTAFFRSPHNTSYHGLAQHARRGKDCSVICFNVLTFTLVCCFVQIGSECSDDSPFLPMIEKAYASLHRPQSCHDGYTHCMKAYASRQGTGLGDLLHTPVCETCSILLSARLAPYSWPAHLCPWVASISNGPISAKGLHERVWGLRPVCSHRLLQRS